MPIDVSILRQQAPMQMPSLMESRARANQLMASDAQLAANALQIQRAQREEQQAQDINKLYSLPGAVSPTGEIDYGLLGQGAPGMGLARILPDLNKQRLAEMKARGEAGEAGYKQAKARDEAINQRLKMYQEKYRFVTTPEAALAMHDQVHSDPVLQNFFDQMGVDAAQGRKRIEQSVANGTFPQFLQEQSASLEQVRGQRAIQTAINAANEKFGTTTTPDGRTMRVGFDRKGYAVEVTENLSKQGFPDLAKQYLEQQLEMAKLKYAGLSAEAATLAAMRDDPELFEMARRLKAAGANRQTVKVGIGEQLSPGQKKVDEKFADDYVQWTSGDRARSEMGLSFMGNVIRDLKAGKTLSGPILALVPDALLAFSSTGAASVKAREDIERIVQEDLRATLGAQFTEKEGTGFLKRVFNPSLSGPQLLDRLERLYRQMDVARQQRDAMAEHFEANETLRGYKGPRPSLVDFQSSILGGGKTDKGAAPAAAKTPDAFSDAEKERAYQEWKSKKK